MPLLLNLLQNSHDKISLMRNGTWALSNLCRGKPCPDFKFVAEALPMLSQLINVNDDETNTDACWALSYISDDTDNSNDKIQAIVSLGIIPRLNQLLAHPKVKVIYISTVKSERSYPCVCLLRFWPRRCGPSAILWPALTHRLKLPWKRR